MVVELREIALDTETTGLSPMNGDKLVEIGCVELINKVKTGRVFHTYINPCRDMPEDAFRIHGLSSEFLSDKPSFPDIVDDFIEFLGDATLVIHNASFDMRFINFELSCIGFKKIAMERAIDTLIIARGRFPGAQANLDALCKRFGIDLSKRTKHGALLDADLLADVYVELLGGNQSSMALNTPVQKGGYQAPKGSTPKMQKSSRAYQPSEREKAQHGEFLKKLKKPIWENA